MQKLFPLVTVVGVVASCAPRKPLTPSSVPQTVATVLHVDAGSPIAAVDADAPSDDEVVDARTPTGCAQLYAPGDTCKRLRNMLGARTHSRNRACLARIGNEFSHPPAYYWGCDWVSFTKVGERVNVGNAGYGKGPDCFSDRFGGEGVACAISDHQHPDDDSVYFEATESDVRTCLAGWQEESKATTKTLGDRAFSFSKKLDASDPGLVTRVQGCRGSEAPRSIDENKSSFMRLEIFVERIAPKP